MMLWAGGKVGSPVWPTEAQMAAMEATQEPVLIGQHAAPPGKPRHEIRGLLLKAFPRTQTSRIFPGHLCLAPFRCNDLIYLRTGCRGGRRGADDGVAAAAGRLARAALRPALRAPRDPPQARAHDRARRQGHGRQLGGGGGRDRSDACKPHDHRCGLHGLRSPIVSARMLAGRWSSAASAAR